VLEVSNENIYASDLSATKSCVSGPWNLENDTTNGQTGTAAHRSRPPADQSRKLNGEVARHARNPRIAYSILARMSHVRV